MYPLGTFETCSSWFLCSLVVRTLEQYSRGPGSSHGLEMCFNINKVTSSWKTPLQVAPEGVLTYSSIAKY